MSEPTTGIKITALKPEAIQTVQSLSAMMREYVAGGTAQPFLDIIRALPRYVDDAERDFGPDLYERMLRDPILRGSADTIIMRVLEDDLGIVPPMDRPDPKKAQQADIGRYEQGKKVAGFVKAGLDDMAERTMFSIEDILADMLDAVFVGHRLAEQTLQHSMITGTDQLLWQSIKPRPRRNYVFAADAHMNVLGVIALVPGGNQVLPTGMLQVEPNDPRILPLEKFFVMIFGAKNGNPLGTAALRPVYNAWWVKLQTWPQLLRFLCLVAGGSIVGYTPEGAMLPAGYPDKSKTPEDLMRDALEMFQNGSIGVFKAGSKVDLLQSTSEGKAFFDTIDLCNREMVHGVLKQVRATMEAEHGSKADSGSATDILDVLIRWIRAIVARQLRNQVFRRVVSINFGVGIAREFTPRATMAKAVTPDYAKWAVGTAALQTSGFLHWSQKQGMDEEGGLPPADYEAIAAEQAEQQDAQRMGRAQAQRLIDSGVG
jgi:hypothetical protein